MHTPTRIDRFAVNGVATSIWETGPTKISEYKSNQTWNLIRLVANPGYDSQGSICGGWAQDLGLQQGYWPQNDRSAPDS